MALSRRSEGCGSFGRPVATGMKKISYSGYLCVPKIRFGVDACSEQRKIAV
jgi:hypothetical protein